MRRLFEFIRRMKEKKTREGQTASRTEQQEDIPPKSGDQTAAVNKPAQTQIREQRPTQEDIAQWRIRLKRAMDFSAGQMPKQIPQEGTDGFYAYKFPLQGTENEALLVVECRDQTLRSLTVRVVPVGTDLCVMHYIRKGTRDELTAYLADEANQDELLDSLRQLSDGADAHRW